MAGRPKRRAHRPTPAGTRTPDDPTPVHDRKELEATGYTWETAQPGNFLALKNGTRSPRLIARLSDELAEVLTERRPDLEQYPLALAALCRAETRAALLNMALDERGLVDDDGEVRDSMLRELRAEERRASEERRNLGLDPSSHARLVRERADATQASWSIDDALAKGRQVLDLRSRDGSEAA